MLRLLQGTHYGASVGGAIGWAVTTGFMTVQTGADLSTVAPQALWGVLPGGLLGMLTGAICIIMERNEEK